MPANILHIRQENKATRVELEIAAKPMWIQAVLLLVFLINIVMSFALLVLIIMKLPKFSFSSLITCGLVGLVTWYFFKLLLWYKGGKEIFIIEKNRIQYFSDYKLFIQNKKEYSFDDFSMIYWSTDSRVKDTDDDILDDMQKEEGQAILGFELDDGRKIDTTVELPFSELRRLAIVLEKKDIRRKG
ncbi:MAG: hypothetical protein ACI94Y_002375 [Maribacter sp.]|jgi:hypothetical protein